MKLASQLRNSIVASLLLLTAPVFGGLYLGNDVLDDGGKVKASIKVSETYSEKIVTKKASDGSPVRTLVPVDVLKATVVGNLGDLDTSTFSNSTVAEIQLGGFGASLPLSLSEEAKAAAGGVFPAGKTKATFLFQDEALDGRGNPVVLKMGSVVFNWAKGKLVVKITCKNLLSFEAGQVAAPGYRGLYVDESSGGTKPSGSVKFTGTPQTCRVAIGGMLGVRNFNVSGTSTTKVKKFGKGDTAETRTLQGVKLKGVTAAVSDTVD